MLPLGHDRMCTYQREDDIAGEKAAEDRLDLCRARSFLRLELLSFPRFLRQGGSLELRLALALPRGIRERADEAL